MADTFSVTAILSAVDKNFSSTFAGAEKAVQSLDSTSQKVTSGYTKTVGKIASATTKGLVAAGTAFGAYAIKSAADLRVVEAQYAQSFKGVESESNKALDGMSKQWNMLPNRIKAPMSNFQSYFRGTGQEAKEALTTTKTAMEIAADSAAYYDKSIEDTSASLKGFLMGNYENGDAIGINTNLTKISAAYNDKYGKSFEDLSEAQKSSYLLEYIQDVYKLNGVIGQASRESGEWENVMGNMTSAVKSFAGAVAEPFMDLLLKNVADLTKYVQGATDGFNAFVKQFQGLDSTAEKIALIKKQLEPLIPLLSFAGAGVGLAGALPLVEKMSPALGTLMGKGKDVTGMLGALGKQGAGVVKGLNFQTVASGFVNAQDKLSGFKVGFLGMDDLFKGIDGTILKTMTGATEFQDKFGKILDPINKVGPGIGSGLQKAASVGLGAMNGMVSGLGTVMSLALTLLGPAAILGVVLAGLGLVNQQFGTQLSEMITTVTTKGPEIINGLVTSITTALPALMASGADILAQLMGAITANVEPVIGGAVTIIQTLVQGVIDALPTLIPAALALVEQLAISIIEAAPKLLQTGLDLLLALVKGISDNADQIVNSATKIMETLITQITNNLPQIIDTGIEILKTLAEAIVKVLPQLIPVAFKAITTLVTGLADKLPDIISAAVDIISTLADGLLDNLPEILSAGVEMILSVVKGIAQNLPEVVSGGIEITAKLVSTLIEAVPDMLNAGKDLVNGFINGIDEMIGGVVDKAKELASSAVDTVKDWLNIGSPSKVLDQIGRWTGEGFINGMTAMLGDVEKAAESMGAAAEPDIGDVEYGLSSAMGSINAAVSGGPSPDDTKQPLMVVVQVDVDGKVIAQTTAPYMAEELQNQQDLSNLGFGWR